MTIPVAYRHHFVRDEINRGEWFNCISYHVIQSRNERDDLADEWLSDVMWMLKRYPRILIAEYDYDSAHLYEVISFDHRNRMLYVTFADKPLELVRLSHNYEPTGRTGRGWTPWGWKDWRGPIDGEYVGKVREMHPREEHFARGDNWP